MRAQLSSLAQSQHHHSNGLVTGEGKVCPQSLRCGGDAKHQVTSIGANPQFAGRLVLRFSKSGAQTSVESCYHLHQLAAAHAKPSLMAQPPPLLALSLLSHNRGTLLLDNSMALRPSDLRVQTGSLQHFRQVVHDLGPHIRHPNVTRISMRHGPRHQV